MPNPYRSPSQPIAEFVDGQLVQEACTVFATEEVNVPAKQSGLIAEIPITKNSRVQLGDLLVQMDSTQEELELKVANYKAKSAYELATDESDIQFADQLVRLAQLELESTETLAGRGNAGDSELRRKRLSLEQAELKVEQAKRDKSQRTIESFLANAAMSLATHKLESMKILSPIQGTITELNHNVGEWVPAGESICRVVRLDELRIDFFVDRSDFSPADLLESRVNITLVDSPGTVPVRFAGVVSGYTRSVTSRGIVCMQATIQNQHLPGKVDWKLLPGMTVSLAVDLPANARTAMRLKYEKQSTK
jgi:multidrug efflux pump subunit AcrA (membrane-fusion protein)